MKTDDGLRRVMARYGYVRRPRVGDWLFMLWGVGTMVFGGIWLAWMIIAIVLAVFGVEIPMPI